MTVKELRAILSVLNDDTEINIEWQEGTRNKAGRTTCLNSVEIEEGFTAVTLKAFISKGSEDKLIPEQINHHLAKPASL